jgi:hypothetical protein
MSSATIIQQTGAHGHPAAGIHGCSHAVLAFSPLNGLKGKLSARPLPEPVLSSIEMSRQFIGRTGSSPVLLLECPADLSNLDGVLGEVAGLGISSVIAYDYAETLTTHIPAGQIVLAESAIDVDRSVHRLAYPHHDLFQKIRAHAARECLSLRRAKILNAHPADPSFRDKTARRREFDTEVVHRHAFDLYLSARRLGLGAVFACVICNRAGEDIDPEDIEPVRQGITELQSLLTSTLSQTFTRLPNRG